MKIKLLLISMLSVLILTGCNGTKETSETGEVEPATEASSEATFYELDTAKSTVTWKGEKITGASHEGTVEIKSGEVFFEEGDLAGGSFTLDMTTIAENVEVQDEKLIGHLRSDDFFGVENYPEATFEITEVTESLEGDRTHIIKGNLTIKDITNSIQFDANVQQTNNNYIANATFEINRTNWDIKFGSDKFFEELGDNAIKDIIEFKLDLATTESL